MTDEALTAQAVEWPCTPLAAAFPTLYLASVFAVNVTEMAKLGSQLNYFLILDWRIATDCTEIGAVQPWMRWTAYEDHPLVY